MASAGTVGNFLTPTALLPERDRCPDSDWFYPSGSHFYSRLPACYPLRSENAGRSSDTCRLERVIGGSAWKNPEDCNWLTQGFIRTGLKYPDSVQTVTLTSSPGGETAGKPAGWPPFSEQLPDKHKKT